jgi:hypothetical protein
MDGFAGGDQLTLTPDEQWLVATLRAGAIADFQTREGNGRIRAMVLRDLLLKCHDAGTVESLLPLMGIRIKNACLHGTLDLADLAQPFSGLPALVLEDCDLPDDINLEGSRFARLSIKGSRFSYLNMRESEIDGPFDFSDAKPYHSHLGKPLKAWIDARGCIINARSWVPERGYWGPSLVLWTM